MTRNIDQLKQDAYYKGVEDSDGRLLEREEFRQSDEFQNEVFPELEEMAGYEDGEVKEVEVTADDYNGVMTVRSSALLSDIVTWYLKGRCQ